MSKRRREVKEYRYDCTLTGEQYTVTTKAENPDELMSVNAWYEMHPEKDDRPEDVKVYLGLKEKAAAEAEALKESNEE